MLKDIVELLYCNYLFKFILIVPVLLGNHGNILTLLPTLPLIFYASNVQSNSFKSYNAVFFWKYHTIRTGHGGYGMFYIPILLSTLVNIKWTISVHPHEVHYFYTIKGTMYSGPLDTISWNFKINN